MARYIKAVGGMFHSVIYTDNTGKYFRFIGGTWAWQNHNPGNIFPGTISIDHNQIGKVKTHNISSFSGLSIGS